MEKKLSLQVILAFEEAYDRGKLDRCRQGAGSGIVPLCEALLKRDWEAFYPEAEGLFAAASDPLLKAFVLQWAVAATEIEYDLKKRERWLSRWAEIPAWAARPYCLYLWTFQSALSAFFEGSLREAEARFRRALEIALQFDYARGRMRALFHLGLVYRDLGNLSMAADFFREALALTRTRKAVKLIERIEAQLGQMGGKGSYCFEQAKREIESLMLSGDFQGARRKLVEAEVQRRQARLNRRRESLFIFLPLIAMGTGRRRIVERLLARISDPILKIRVLELKKTVFDLAEAEVLELVTLKTMHGISDVITQSTMDSDSAEVCGIPVRAVADADIKALIQLLLASSDPVGKEQICNQVWGLEYDPVVHDGKIYKLFHRARNLFKRSDLFENCYGAYRLNPAFLPAGMSLGGVKAS